MTEVVLHQSPSHFPSTTSSSSPSSSTSSTTCDGSDPNALINSQIIESHLGSEEEEEEEEQEEEESCGFSERKRKERDRDQGDQLSVLELLVAAFRKSMIGPCSNTERGKFSSAMEIGWPSNVRHVAHVTFDRFNGFLGLPVEFEPEVPRRPPSARSVLPKKIFFLDV